MFKNIKLLKELREESTKIDYEFDNYNSRNEAEVLMKIENEDDIVSSLSMGEDLMVNESFETFISNSVSHIEPDKKIDLKISCENNIYDDEKTNIKNAIKNHYTKKISSINDDLHKNAIDNIFLTVASVAVLALIIVLSKFSYLTLLIEILDIFAWVLLWEVFDNFIFRRRELRKIAIKNYQILNMRIEFLETKEKSENGKY